VPRGKKTAERKTQKRSELAEVLNRAFREQQLAKAGGRVGVAVSGGADSVALLRLLAQLRAKLGIVISAVHFNHQLRGKASASDERFVAALAHKLGMPLRVKREDIAQKAKKEKRNLEEAGRRARYSFFEGLVQEGVVDVVATAHTMDDQAETVLAHILRGTGLAGLGAIHPRAGAVIRPLLQTRRADLRKYLRALRQPWREDKTNADTKRMRARIRQKLMPLLEKKFQPLAVEHLAQLAEFAREDEAFLQKEADLRVLAFVKEEAGGMSIPTYELLQTKKQPASSRQTESALLENDVNKHLAMSKRMVRQIVKLVKPRSGQLSALHVNAVLRLASASESGKMVRLPGGLLVRRESDVLRFRAISDSESLCKRDTSRDYAYEIDLSAGWKTLPLVELSFLLHFREIDWPAEGRETSTTGTFLDRSRLRWPLMIRNWQPGDAMRPKGHQKMHTLARLLNEKSVSRWDKAHWPVLTCGGKLAWARGLEASVEFATSPETRRAVWIVEEPIL